jgi:hypothetical protein
MEYLIGVIAGVAGVVVVMRLPAWGRDAGRDPVCGMEVRPDSPEVRGGAATLAGSARGPIG